MYRRVAMTTLALLLVDTVVDAQAAPQQLQARELWRIDGSEHGDPFADIRDYVALSDGSLWVLDFKDQIIRRYDANGKPLSIVGRKGSGPGEMREANGMAVAPNGSVWVNDWINARINVFAADGRFQRQIAHNPGGHGYRWDGWFDRSTGHLVQGSIGGVQRWRVMTATGDSAASLAYTSCHDGQPSPATIQATSKNGELYASYPFSQGGGLAPTGNATAWCASARATRAALVKVGTGDTILQTSVVVPNVPLTTAERDSAIAAIETSVARYTTNTFDKSKVPTTKPGIAAISADGDGRLWVRLTARRGVTNTMYDLYEESGKYLGRLTLPVRNIGHHPVRAKGNEFWLTVLDDDDVPSIVKYRIGR